MNITAMTPMKDWIVSQQLYVGIAIGGTKTSFIVGSQEGEIFYSQTFPTRAYYADVLSDLDAAIDQFLHSAKAYVKDPLQVIRAIGISSGGPLDPVAGTINDPPNLPTWNHVPVVDHFRSRYHIDCYLENDANAGALAEWFWGNGRGCSHIIYLTFGTGLGAGMILNGRLYAGASHLAGEVGHVRMSNMGPLAYGKEGSWESYCSGSGLSRLYTYLHGESNLTAKDICDLADSGDEKALAVMQQSSEYLGKGLAMIIDMLNPEKIIIGSIFSRRENLFRTVMQNYLEAECLPGTLSRCEILTSALGTQLDEKGALATVVYHKKLQHNKMESAV